MTLKELKEKIDKLVEINEHQGNDSLDVRVITQDKSIGARASVGIKDIYRGFDWESGKVLIIPDNNIYQETREDEIEKLEIPVAGTDKIVLLCPICEERVSKKDNFCKHCGKKFNRGE